MTHFVLRNRLSFEPKEKFLREQAANKNCSVAQFPIYIVALQEIAPVLISFERLMFSGAVPNQISCNTINAI